MTQDPGLADFAALNPDPMMKTDREGTPVYLNPAAKTLFPELADAAVQHPLLAGWREVSSFLESCADQVPFVRQVTVSRRVYEEHIFHALDRTQFWMYINDVTEREQVNHLKQEFLQNVCHELNTPLTCLCGCLQSLREDLLEEMSPAQDSFMQVAIRGAQHLADMVQDLGDSALVQQGRLRVEPRRMDAGPLVADAVAAFRRSESGGCALTAEIPQDLPPVLADPIRVRQVLNNLISNARKFTPPEGTVRVRARVSPGDSAFLCLEVSDTGCGIDPQDARRLFERMFKAETPGRSRNGLGIGLYLSRELVSRQGGRIWMESQPGQGSSFYFTLPVFSMETLILPLLGRGPVEGFSLITLRVLDPDRCIEGRMRLEILRSARAATDSVLSEDEFLLPEVSEDGQEGMLFLLCRKTPEQAVELGKGLAARLSAATESFRIGLHSTVEVNPLPLPPGTAGLELAGSAAPVVEMMVRRELRRRPHECSPA